MSQKLKLQELADYYQLSEKTIRNLIKDGTFKLGVHYIDTRRTNSSVPVYRFNQVKCDEVFAISVEKRKIRK